MMIVNLITLLFFIIFIFPGIIFYLIITPIVKGFNEAECLLKNKMKVYYYFEATIIIYIIIAIGAKYV